MGVGLTDMQRQWAAQHDWFEYCDRLSGDSRVSARYSVTCRVFESGPDGSLRMDERTFTDYKALREWAGY